MLAVVIHYLVRRRPSKQEKAVDLMVLFEKLPAGSLSVSRPVGLSSFTTSSIYQRFNGLHNNRYHQSPTERRR